MKRRIYLTENDLRNIVRRAVNEVRGWTLEEDDVTWVDDPNEADRVSKAWMVRLWTGSGYYLPAFGAVATCEEEALEHVVAYLDQKGDDSFFVDDAVEREISEMEQEGLDQEEIDEKIDEWAYYVDATMDGADQPHYVFSENLGVYPYDKSRFKH